MWHVLCNIYADKYYPLFPRLNHMIYAIMMPLSTLLGTYLIAFVGTIQPLNVHPGLLRYVCFAHMIVIYRVALYTFLYSACPRTFYKYDDVITWKCFPRYRSSVNSPRKGPVMRSCVFFVDNLHTLLKSTKSPVSTVMTKYSVYWTSFIHIYHIYREQH